MNTYNEAGHLSMQMTPDNMNHQEIAMAYVPWQNLSSIYEPDKALQAGTIFPELNKPFGGRRIK